MASESLKAIANRARERFNAGDLDGYLRVYDASITLYGLGLPPGIEAVRAFYQQFFAGFSSSELVFLDEIESGDSLALRFELRARHTGPFQGIPATGKDVVVPGITILRFVDGKCVERWSQSDFLGLMQQLGAIPAPSAA